MGECEILILAYRPYKLYLESESFICRAAHFSSVSGLIQFKENYSTSLIQIV